MSKPSSGMLACPLTQQDVSVVLMLEIAARNSDTRNNERIRNTNIHWSNSDPNYVNKGIEVTTTRKDVLCVFTSHVFICKIE